MQMTWRGTDLYWGRRKVGSIVPDGRYPGHVARASIRWIAKRYSQSSLRPPVAVIALGVLAVMIWLATFGSGFLSAIWFILVRHQPAIVRAWQRVNLVVDHLRRASRQAQDPQQHDEQSADDQDAKRSPPPRHVITSSRDYSRTGSRRVMRRQPHPSASTPSFALPFTTPAIARLFGLIVATR
jgi:hypothetical protein